MCAPYLLLALEVALVHGCFRYHLPCLVKDARIEFAP